MEKNIFIWIGMAAVAFFILRAYLFSNKQENIVDKEINEIVNSDKYKVKGQYD